MSDSQLRALQKEIHEIAIKVAKGEEAHDNLKEMLEKHIKNSEKWREATDSQMQAIANAILQDQTRDVVESEHEHKQQQQEVQWTNTKVVLWTTAILAIATILANFREVIGLIKSALSIF